LRPSESSTHEPGGAVRTYHGRTIEELIPRIQDELGADAIIVRRREGLTGGLAGFFQRRFVELDATAGGPRLDVYDEEDAAHPPHLRPQHSLSSEHRSPSEHRPPSEHRSPEEHGFPAEYRSPERQPIDASARAPFYTREPPSHGPDHRYVTEDLAALARAWRPQQIPTPPLHIASEPTRYELRSANPSDPFARMLQHASTASHPSYPSTASRSSYASPASPASHASHASTPSTTADTPSGANQPVAQRHPRSRVQADIRGRLVALGVSERLADELLDAAAIHIRPLAPRIGFNQAVRSALAERIPVTAPLPARGAAIVLVGPGGAGKTSCCAALLGAYRRGSSLPASCATLVRVAGKAELHVLLSPHIRRPVPIDSSRAARALRKARSEGLLVIDTPPLSPGERSAIRKLASLRGQLKPERVVIVLPATLGAVAAAQLLHALSPLGANALALTHADETDQIGVAVEAAYRFGLAPEYTLKRGRTSGWAIARTDPTGLAATLVQ
jgi:flagellar biosynthesis GTPase FlhF